MNIVDLALGLRLLNLISQKQFLLGDFRSIHGINLRKFFLLIFGERKRRRRFFEAFHRQFVSRFHRSILLLLVLLLLLFLPNSSFPPRRTLVTRSRHQSSKRPASVASPFRRERVGVRVLFDIITPSRNPSP